MIQHIFRAALFIALATWLKPRARGLLCLIIVLAITFGLHIEFKDYVKITGNDDYLIISYLVKYAILFVSIASYYFFVEVRIKLKKDTSKNDGSLNENIIEDDGFDFLREI